jgi:hypothetical protein
MYYVLLVSTCEYVTHVCVYYVWRTAWYIHIDRPPPHIAQNKNKLHVWRIQWPANPCATYTHALENFLRDERDFPRVDEEYICVLHVWIMCAQMNTTDSSAHIIALNIYTYSLSLHFEIYDVLILNYDLACSNISYILLVLNTNGDIPITKLPTACLGAWCNIKHTYACNRSTP